MAKIYIHDMCIRFYIPEEGEEGGGSSVGCRANKFLILFLIPGKPCWFCCVNLGVLQFVGSLSGVWQ